MTRARPSSMRIALGAGAALLVLVVSVAGWQTWQRHSRIAHGIPATPERLVSAPLELRQRIWAAENQARHGPDRTKALAVLARLYQANEYLPEAAACYRLLLSLEPANPRWPHLLATILSASGRLDEALPLLRGAVEHAPDNALLRLQLADALLKQNQPGAAAGEYQAALERGGVDAFALLGVARCEMAANKWSDARQHLRAAVAANPRIDRAWGLLATVCDRLQLPDEAAAARARSEGRKPEPFDPWLHEVLLDCYDNFRISAAADKLNESGRPRRALELVTAALSRSPDDGALLLQAGKLHGQLGDAAGARQCLERAVAVSPQNDQAWVALTIFYAARGDSAAAEQALSSGLAHCPDSASLHLGNGRRLLQGGRLDEAEREFREAIRLRPRQVEARLDLARLCYQAGRTEEAVEQLRAALAAEPGNPDALIMLAHAAIERGDESAALDWIRRVRNKPGIAPARTKMLAQAFREKFGHEASLPSRSIPDATKEP